MLIDHYLGADHKHVPIYPITRWLIENNIWSDGPIFPVQGALLVKRTLRILPAQINLSSISAQAVEGSRQNVIWAIASLELWIFPQHAVGGINIKQIARPRYIPHPNHLLASCRQSGRYDGC